MSVRVRFAPSPTGDLHIGGARTALYNYLFAKHKKGTFVLRVEDTDRQRSTKESLQTIIDGMKWLGFSYDEGPYYQSERLELYQAAAKRLEKDGKAYWQDDPEKGRALYFRIPRDEKVQWDDLVLGNIAIDPAADKSYGRDLVIQKSDGFPTYHFACVVDDADMKITHIIRGQDHVANTTKQIMLYRAMGVEPPHFAHIPLIFDPQGAKISKRKQYDFPVTVGDVQKMGYLAAPFVNFLALLGWSPGDDREIVSIQEMIDLFSLERVSKSPARFLRDKLDHMNGLVIRAMKLEEVVELCRPYLDDAYDLSSVTPETITEAVRQQQERLKRLDEIVPLTKFAFVNQIEYEEKAVRKVLQKNDAFAVLDDVKAAIEAMDSFTGEGVMAILNGIVEKREIKLKDVAQPLRVALTGTTVSPPIQETVLLLGRDRVLDRIGQALQLRQSA